MGFRVFMSYSSADKRIIDKLENDIRVLDIEVYRYEYDLQPGRPVDEKIKQAIQSSDAFILVLTQQSQYSPYVHQEIGVAETLQKPIIPMVEEGLPGKILGMLQGREYIPFSHKNLEKARTVLLNYLQKLKSRKDLLTAIAAIGFLILILFALSKE
ncbi:MAG: toll/interleukin-1 receptor domain-containing protein [Candidatus Methanomethylicaceae archaeon]